MSAFVVDASVAAKWWFPEVHYQAAWRLRDPDHDLHAPELFDLERLKRELPAKRISRFTNDAVRARLRARIGWMNQAELREAEAAVLIKLGFFTSISWSDGGPDLPDAKPG